MPTSTTPEHPHKRHRLSPTTSPNTFHASPATESSEARFEPQATNNTSCATSPPTYGPLPATTTTRAEAYAIWNTPLTSPISRPLIAQPTNYTPYLPSSRSPFPRPICPTIPESTIEGINGQITRYSLELRRWELEDYCWRKEKFWELYGLIRIRLEVVMGWFAEMMLRQEARARREEKRRRRVRRRRQMMEILTRQWLGGRPRG